MLLWLRFAAARLRFEGFLTLGGRLRAGGAGICGGVWLVAAAAVAMVAVVCSAALFCDTIVVLVVTVTWSDGSTFTAAMPKKGNGLSLSVNRVETGGSISSE